MTTMMRSLCSVLMFVVAAVGQGQTPPVAKPVAEPVAEPVARSGAGRTVSPMSAAGREALQRCKEIAAGAKGERGAARLQVLANAAADSDRVAAGFVSEASVAAAAAFAAAELWRRHGSMPLAEKDYLLAAKVDPGRFGQRGVLGAADMQRRQKRFADALATYRRVVAMEPGNGRAHVARLEISKLLRILERIDDAIAAAQLALECARPGRQTIDACNQLALLWIAKGDLDAAGRALGHAEDSIGGVDNADPIVAERLQKAVELMSARRALRRAVDKVNDAAGDAARLDAARQKGEGRHRGRDQL